MTFEIIISIQATLPLGVLFGVVVLSECRKTAAHSKAEHAKPYQVYITK